MTHEHQSTLFDLPPPADPAVPQAVVPSDDLLALGARLPPQLHLGTSSWNFPGWEGLVWRATHAESTLSRAGLPAYAAHPLFRTVSLDSAFYRVLSQQRYAELASQVPEGFRFVVKAPAALTDALIREPDGRGKRPNPGFLDPSLAMDAVWAPITAGLGSKLGALVLQLSPLPAAWLTQPEALFDRIEHVLEQLGQARRASGRYEALIAVEGRDALFIDPRFAALLKRHRATWCLALHARMPPIEQQLPMLRALWPGPLVARWNLHARHGTHGYESAKASYAPFNRLLDPDLPTRQTLAKVAAATARAGQPVFITINNKAEGSAPLSVEALAGEIDAGLTGAPVR